MKLEDQVCSLPLAKRLKELGVSEDSLFVWQGAGEDWEVMSREHSGSNIAAFTVAELGEMLPGGTESFRDSDEVNPEYWTRLKDEEENPDHRAKTEADARAKTLIYLLENNLITL